MYENNENKENKLNMNLDSAQELSEVLDALGDKIPKLIKGLMDSVYSKEAGASMGASVGAYYKELLTAGIPQDAALELVKEFAFSMKDMNLGNIG